MNTKTIATVYILLSLLHSSHLLKAATTSDYKLASCRNQDQLADSMYNLKRELGYSEAIGQLGQLGGIDYYLGKLQALACALHTQELFMTAWHALKLAREQLQTAHKELHDLIGDGETPSLDPDSMSDDARSIALNLKKLLENPAKEIPTLKPETLQRIIKALCAHQDYDARCIGNILTVQYKIFCATAEYKNAKKTFNDTRKACVQLAAIIHSIKTNSQKISKLTVNFTSVTDNFITDKTHRVFWNPDRMSDAEFETYTLLCEQHHLHSLYKNVITEIGFLMHFTLRLEKPAESLPGINALFLAASSSHTDQRLCAENR
jgi:hypothetical protein